MLSEMRVLGVRAYAKQVSNAIERREEAELAGGEVELNRGMKLFFAVCTGDLLGMRLGPPRRQETNTSMEGSIGPKRRGGFLSFWRRGWCIKLMGFVLLLCGRYM
jgi:hypothetical protein